MSVPPSSCRSAASGSSTTSLVPASMTDRDIARELLFRLRLTCLKVVLVYADSGELVSWAKRFLGMTISVVSRPPNATGFVLLPRRWVVERTLSWLLRARRNVREYERLPQHSEAAYLVGESP